MAYSFLLDSGPVDARVRPSGLRRLEWFLQNTDPSYVYLEMDIYWAHVAQFKHKVYTAPDGTAVENIFDPAGLVAAQTQRFPLFHAKDGKSNPATANGYDMVPFGGHRLHDVLPAQAKGYHNPMWEQDTASRRRREPRPVAAVRADVVRRHGRAARLILETDRIA